MGVTGEFQKIAGRGVGPEDKILEVLMIPQISEAELYNAFLSGAREVKKARQYMNSINIFPVADGDTGSNLDAMMQYILDEASLKPTPKETMESIADAALVGARGNSGLIFAEYINGMSLEMEDSEQLSLPVLMETMDRAVPYASHAVSAPVEGTMLTVMREWGRALMDSALAEDLGHRLELALEQVRETLAQTARLNPFLRRENVIDSGAKGFVCFLEGFVRYLRGDRTEVEQVEEEPLTTDFRDVHFTEGELVHRYCTEILIDSGVGMEEGFGEELKAMGDSLLIAANAHKTKVHIHTNDPMRVASFLMNHGTITQQKIDDMFREFEAIHNRKYPIALVVDSVAEIDPELLSRYQIHVVPLQILAGGHVFLDGLSINGERYFEMEDSLEEPPSSSLPNPRHIESVLKLLTETYDSIVVMTVASALSGTYEAFRKAAEKIRETGYSIDVIDTCLNSGAQGLASLLTARDIDAGLSHSQVVERARERCRQTRILVSVASLKPMIRSGRISRRAGAVLEAVGIKPIVSLDEKGKGVLEDKALSLAGSEKKILNRIRRVHREQGIGSYCIVEGRGLPRARRLAEACRKITGKDPEYIASVSTVIAVNAGSNTTAVCYLAGGRPEEGETV